mgnify:CR=1 FL=1
MWAHSLREGRRAGVSPRQLSGPRPLVLDRRARRRSHPLRHDRLPAGVAQREHRRADQRRSATDGIVDLKVGAVLGAGAADRSRDRRDRRCTRRRPIAKRRRDRRVVVPRRRDRQHATTTPRAWCAPSTCAPASCCGRSTPSRCRASSATTRGNATPWAINGNTGVWTQITVDEELGLVLPAGRDADVGLLRRPSARQQPVRREPRLRRSEDRPAQVALPARAPSALELRHVVGGDPRGHHRERPRDQGGRRPRQAGIPVTCSIASPVSRYGRSRSGRCRSPTCRARRRARRSRSRPSRRPTRATCSRCRTT